MLCTSCCDVGQPAWQLACHSSWEATLQPCCFHVVVQCFQQEGNAFCQQQLATLQQQMQLQASNISSTLSKPHRRQPKVRHNAQ